MSTASSARGWRPWSSHRERRAPDPTPSPPWSRHCEKGVAARSELLLGVLVCEISRHSYLLCRTREEHQIRRCRRRGRGTAMERAGYEYARYQGVRHIHIFRIRCMMHDVMRCANGAMRRRTVTPDLAPCFGLRGFLRAIRGS